MHIITMMIAFFRWALEVDHRWPKIVLLGILMAAIHFDLVLRGAGFFVSSLILSLAVDGVWPFTTLVWLVLFVLRPAFALFAPEEHHHSPPLSPPPRKIHATRWYDEEDRPKSQATENIPRPVQPAWQGARPAPPPSTTTTEGISAEEFRRRYAEARRTSTTKTDDDEEREAFDRLPCRIAGVIARVAFGVLFARSQSGTAYYIDVFSQRFSYDFPSTYSWLLTDPMADPLCHIETISPQPAPQAAAATTGPTIVPNPLSACKDTREAGFMIRTWLLDPKENIFKNFADMDSAQLRDGSYLSTARRVHYIALGNKLGFISAYYSENWARLIGANKDDVICSQLKWMGLRGPMFNKTLAVLHDELKEGRESIYRGTPVERAYQVLNGLEEKLPHWLE
ncbi:hypothetical protein Slin15195_G006000 [Septoria linicola]|uniref:Uncharacterized protein n=1 Tax=Septoria linicola TaxID=215465 RepID=A0A9Q9ED12_9PEZI|nr:hypothetical protein Slin15195_G006000 [Septoria linicola]